MVDNTNATCILSVPSPTTNIAGEPIFKIMGVSGADPGFSWGGGGAA